MSVELPSFISADHQRRLAWFDQHKGEIFPLSRLQEDKNALLAAKAKGIYEPKGWEYSLSIRIMEASRYSDSKEVRLPDGRWQLRYFQEDPDPAKFLENPDPVLRDRWASNRGLMKCKDDKVPVGVLREAEKIGRQTQYLILGLATVVGWSGGFFQLESASVDMRDLELAAHYEVDADAQVPENDYDARLRVQQEIVRRQGQSAFRARLMRAYQGRCAVTACDAPTVLEAAHLRPYRGPDSNQVTNGLLLRPDIHILLDLRMLAPDPASRIIRVSPQLAGTYYGKFDGRRLAEPETKSQRPAEEALQTVWQEFLRENSL